jgi:hypothetical protein
MMDQQVIEDTFRKLETDSGADVLDLLERCATWESIYRQSVQPPPPTRTVTTDRSCDLSTTCPVCLSEMTPEHAHYRCAKCGYRDSCCF